MGRGKCKRQPPKNWSREKDPEEKGWVIQQTTKPKEAGRKSGWGKGRD